MKSFLLVAMVVALGLKANALPPEQEAFWKNLKALCGQTFEGRMVEGTAASDTAFAKEKLVMHVRDCGPNEIQIPFHVGNDRSRTWVITRTEKGLRLKHDHRHEDGTPDRVTQYGGDTADAGSAEQQDFPADTYTAELIPAAKTNIWTLRVVPGKIFGYGLRREAEGRRFRVEFVLGGKG